MKYQNPRIPEGINVSAEHPLKDFFFMLLAVGLSTILLVILLSLVASEMARFIPFGVEQKLARQVAQSVASKDTLEEQRVRSYLQRLADELAAAQRLPDGMAITLHYIDEDSVNAFATLGGHVFVTRGLLESVPNENALSMALAHEIAHIKHRDPIVALGRGITVGIALLSIAGVGDGSMAQGLIGQVSLVTGLSFSRRQEARADEQALHTLLAKYGHVAGADALFDLFVTLQTGRDTPVLLSTHPMSDDRREKVRAFAARNPPGEIRVTTPLPDWLTSALRERASP